MDIRDFISLLEREGELLKVSEEVDWRYEIGDRTRQAQADRVHSKALLFENVRGYPGSRVFSSGLGSFPRIALALGLGRQTSKRQLIKIFRQRISRPLEPVVGPGGAYRENILTGDDLDLTRLSVPWWNRADAGRYIGTWHLNITKDPETGVRNVGVYRMQLLNSRSAAVSYSRDGDIAQHIAKAEKKDEPLQMAVAIGVDEILVMAAASGFARGVDEFYPSGGLMTRAALLARCETIDVEVPASAEIIIEGNILPGKRVREGPYFDYLGVPVPNPSASVFEASRLMFRNNPVFRGAAIGLPGAEDHILFSVLSGVGCLDFHGTWKAQKFQNVMFNRGLYRALQKVFELRRKMSKTFRG